MTRWEYDKLSKVTFSILKNEISSQYRRQQLFKKLGHRYFELYLRSRKKWALNVEFPKKDLG